MLTTHDSRLTTRKAGFTLVELMIATVIFSLTLLICATGFVQIGRIFYKGVTTARTQEVARTIVDEVSRGLQFSNGQVVCVDQSGPAAPAPPEDPPGPPGGPPGQPGGPPGSPGPPGGPPGQPGGPPEESPEESGNPCAPATLNGTLCIAGTHYIFRLNQRVTPTNSGLLRATTAATTACGSVTTGSELLFENMRLIDFGVSCPDTPEICDLRVVIANGEDDLLNINTAERTAECFGGRAGTQFCAVTSLRTSVTRRVQ